MRVSHAECPTARATGLAVLECPRHLGEFDPVAAHLELVVTPAQTNEIAVRKGNH
ncbi:MAG: hypothetical protein IPJ33_14530 [Gammaproteobacteria bacterium]|nr:hypothetical protein [Gammaproteobacteria bacterium]